MQRIRNGKQRFRPGPGSIFPVPHPTERNFYWLTEIGKGWAQDVIDRNLV
jgi:hypothetical protein